MTPADVIVLPGPPGTAIVIPVLRPRSNESVAENVAPPVQVMARKVDQLNDAVPLATDNVATVSSRFDLIATVEPDEPAIVGALVSTKV